MKLTEPRLYVLRCLADPVHGRTLGHLWISYKGPCTPSGAERTIDGALQWLRRHGLVERYNYRAWFYISLPMFWSITDAGRKALIDAERKEKEKRA